MFKWLKNLFRKEPSKVEALLEELLSRSAPSAPSASVEEILAAFWEERVEPRIGELEQRLSELEASDSEDDSNERQNARLEQLEQRLSELEASDSSIDEDDFNERFDARMEYHNLIDEDHCGLIEDLDSALDEENVVRSLELEEAKEAIWEELRELRSKNNASPFDDRDTAVLESFCRFLTALKEE